MHYKNGREAKVGDKIMGVDTNGDPVAGILIQAQPGSNTCNGYVIPVAVAMRNASMVTIGDINHAEDGYPAKAPK